jgi:quercetin dioxygenase-like cupin family protein
MLKVIKELTKNELMPGFNGRFVHAKSFTIAYWEIDKDAILPKHSHIHEQTTQVTEGTLELTVEGKKHILVPGTILVIPSNSVHSGKAITNCKVTDTFCPVRTEYQ